MYNFLIKDRDGVAAIEFALIIPIVLTLFLGIIQFGFILFIQNHMFDVARDSVRRFAVGETTQAETVQYAQDALLNWNITYTVVVTPHPNDPDDNDVNIRISLPRSSAAIADILGVFQAGTLVASVTMLVE